MEVLRCKAQAFPAPRVKSWQRTVGRSKNPKTVVGKPHGFHLPPSTPQFLFGVGHSFLGGNFSGKFGNHLALAKQKQNHTLLGIKILVYDLVYASLVPSVWMFFSQFMSAQRRCSLWCLLWYDTRGVMKGSSKLTLKLQGSLKNQTWPNL